jgi:hypothetical protein
MKAVRATIPISEVARSVGITTGNYMLKDGGFRGYVSNGPRLQANDPEPIEHAVPDKMIDVVYNEGKCYKCGAKDFEVLRVYFVGTMGKCRKCANDFVISSQISQKEYEAKFGLK